MATKQETVTVLQASVTTYETKIRQLESLGGDQQSTADLHRRQNQRLTSELDQAKLDNTSLLQENEYALNLIYIEKLFENFINVILN